MQGTLIYWHCISAPVLLVNVILFMSFVKGLCFGIWSDETAAKTSTGTHKRNNIKTTVKMFFTLGIPYVCDLIAWSLLWSYGHKNFTILVITSVLKVINAAQGFIMFCVIYLDDSKVRKLYQTTLSYTTRLSTTQGSIAEGKNNIIVNHSMKKGATSKVLPSQTVNPDAHESKSLISDSGVIKQKAAKNQNELIEMHQLKQKEKSTKYEI